MTLHHVLYLQHRPIRVPFLSCQGKHKCLFFFFFVYFTIYGSQSNAASYTRFDL